LQISGEDCAAMGVIEVSEAIGGGGNNNHHHHHQDDMFPDAFIIPPPGGPGQCSSLSLGDHSSGSEPV